MLKNLSVSKYINKTYFDTGKFFITLSNFEF